MSERQVNLPALLRALRELDHQQLRTDWIGDREVSWFYWRGDVEQALGYAPSELFPEYTEEQLAVPTEVFFRKKEKRDE